MGDDGQVKCMCPEAGMPGRAEDLLTNAPKVYVSPLATSQRGAVLRG